MLQWWYRQLRKTTIGIVTVALLFISSLCLPIAVHGQISAQTPEAQYIQANQKFQAGKYEEALAAWQTALKLYQTQNNQQGEQLSLTGLAATLLKLERYQVAIDALEALLQLAQTPASEPTRARALSNLGIAEKYLGRYVQAIRHHKQSARIFYKLGDRSALAQSLLNLGNAYEAIGDYEKAEIAFTQSLKISQKYRDRQREGILLNNLGALSATMGETQAAIKQLQASLRLQQSLQNPAGELLALSSLGGVFHWQKQLPAAIAHYKQALTIAQQLQQRQRQVDLLSSLALAYSDQQNYEQAIALHNQSIQLAKELAVPESLANALNNQAETLYRAGELRNAIASVKQAIQTLEKLRRGISDTYKVSIFDTQLNSYKLLEQILIADNQPEAALEATEQGRARALAELIDTDTTPQSITLRQIRQIAKQQKATIVEYSLVPDADYRFLGKQRGNVESIFIWVVQPNGEITFRQVDTKVNRQTQGTLNQIVATARCLNPAPICPTVEEIANTRGIRISTVTPSSKPKTPSLETTTTSSTPKGTVHDALSYPGLPELHKLLIAPIADVLPNDPHDRVIIIPQESLFLIPFPALVDANGEYLMQQHTLSSVPSIYVLGLTQRSSQPWNRPEDLVVLGNPAPMPAQLSPLPAAETEAIAVAQMLKTQPLIGKNATYENLLRRVASAKLIHLATHGLLEYGQANAIDAPGAIALAKTTTDKAAFLTATEIARLKTQADLVVLSACDTGRGIITGDGVLGLSRSWLAAGASSVIVSLWAVNDQSTAYLMQQFYQILQTQPDRAIALRQAMLKTREKYPSPYDWAAFTLMGQAGNA